MSEEIVVLKRSDLKEMLQLVIAPVKRDVSMIMDVLKNKEEIKSDWISAGVAAKILSCCTKTVRNKSLMGHIESKKVSDKNYRYFYQDVIAYNSNPKYRYYSDRIAKKKRDDDNALKQGKPFSFLK